MKIIDKINLGLMVLSCICTNAFANTIIDLNKQITISPEQLISQLVNIDYLLLGELHDNPHHHQLRAELLSKLANQKYSVIVEYLPFEKKVMFSGSTEQSLEKAGYSSKAWPWNLYRPLFEEIRRTGMPLFGSNLDRSVSRTIFSGGAIPSSMEHAFQKSTLGPNAKSSLEQDLIDGHCGKLPPQYLQPMMVVQRLTDISMAQALIRHQPAILLAGNGHVRKDYGVPQILETLHPKQSKISIGFIEEGQRDQQIWQQLGKRYDYVWITPTIERKDPCADLHFGQSR
jgi:uncharacterized iron-regulated protein